MACAQDAGFGCTCRTVRAAGRSVYPARGKPGESGGFDPLRVKVERCGAIQSDSGGEQVRQILHQHRIADAAAADIEIARVGGGGVDGGVDGLRGVTNQSSQYIFGLFTAFQTTLKPV